MQQTAISIRPIRVEDIEITGKFVYEAFKHFADQHNFREDFPNVEAGIGFADMWINHPQVYGVAAEENGRFIGSNFLTEFDPIRGVGPITVDPSVQSRGAGRKLMEAVIERGKDARGIRLVQEATNTRSMSLYASLGFDIKEPLALMEGHPKGQVSEGTEIRPMTADDLAECEALCSSVHGITRTGELRDAIKYFNPHVAVRERRIVAYASTVTAWHLNHGVAETEQDLTDVLTGASANLGEPVSFLLPTRVASLHRWALSAGLRMIKPLSLMSMGEYHDPRASYFPSVLY
jgi:GNAT superfamily N-acetyltransferase